MSSRWSPRRGCTVLVKGRTERFIVWDQAPSGWWLFRRRDDDTVEWVNARNRDMRPVRELEVSTPKRSR